MKKCLLIFALSLVSFLSFAQTAMPVNRVMEKDSDKILSVVENQIDAFNLHDLDTYLSYYSEDVKIYHFPDLLLFDGKAAMRNAYTQYFSKHPQMKCTVINRIITGNKVIDEEHISGMNDRKDSYATAIYEVKDGKISRVYLIYP